MAIRETSIRDATRSRARTLCVAAALLACAGGFAEQAGAQTVSFCYNDWAPYAVLEDARPRGISVDVLREAAVRAGLEARFRELPWNRCLEMVRQGEIDAVMDAATRPEYLQGPASFSVYSNTIWVPDSNPLMQLDFEALAGSRIGLVSGYEYPDALLETLAENAITIEYSVDDSANIRQLAFGRVEAIVGDFVATHLYADEHGMAIHALAPAHSIDMLYTSFNSERPELHRVIDAAIQEMLDDGTVDRIYAEHVGAAFSEVLGQ